MTNPVGRPRIKKDAMQTSMYLERETVRQMDILRGNLSKSIFIEKVMNYLYHHPEIVKEVLKDDMSESSKGI